MPYPLLRLIMLLPPLAALWLVGISGWGDTVEITGGGQLDGKVQRGTRYTIIQLDDDLQVALPDSRVARTIESDQLAEYRRRAAAAGDDAEQHYQLAIWCGNHVPGETEFYKRRHMERAIALDPDHAQARAWLGFKLQQGRWVNSDDLMRQRGMVSRGGRWELPEALAISDQRSATHGEAKRWIRTIGKLVKTAQGRNSAKAAEALETLAAIDDPLAAEAIAAELDSSRADPRQLEQLRPLRELYVRLLGNFRTMTAVRALVLAGIREDDAPIREAALNQLVHFGASSAVATYLPMLQSNNHDEVNRAARALAWFPDQELALDYVQALVTEHKRVEAPRTGTNVGFDDRGGIGLSYGQKPKVVIEKKTNPAVKALLTAIEPGVDYGYDEPKWLQHFARLRGAYEGDLRRDP